MIRKKVFDITDTVNEKAIRQQEEIFHSDTLIQLQEMNEQSFPTPEDIKQISTHIPKVGSVPQVVIEKWLRTHDGHPQWHQTKQAYERQKRIELAVRRSRLAQRGKQQWTK